MRAQRASLALLLLVGLCGCEEPPCGEDGAPACPPAAAIAIGTICADTNTDPACIDDQAFATLDDETIAPVELVVHMGPQGGFHVFLSARIWGLDPGDATTPKGDAGNPLVKFTVKDGEIVLGTRELQVGLLEGPDGSFERVGVAVILEEDLIMTPNNIDGRGLTVEIEVTDSAGETVADIVSVTAVGIIG